MDNESLLDMMNGSEDVKRMNVFRAELILIQERNIDWFQNRPGVFDWQEHDEIDNHIFITGDNSQQRISFFQDSELPGYIKKEIIEAADRSFL